MASSSERSSSAKKTSTRKTAAKKQSSSAAKKQSGDAAKRQSGGAAKKSPSRARSAPRAESPPTASAAKVAGQAAAELLELTGKAIEGVTGLERSEDGWTIQVEVLEVRRIPDTTDVLALYEVSTDKQGSLEGYRRLRRYARGVPGDD